MSTPPTTPPTPPAPSAIPPAPDVPIVKFEDIEGKLATGDMILFHGSSSESIQIEETTQSYFSHVAMVIRRDASMPALLWQTGPGPIAVDAMTHASHGGAQLSLVRDALIAETLPSYGDTAYIRQMQFARTPEFEIAAQWALSGLDGTPFAALQDLQKQFKEGQRHIVASDRTFFCSDLIAHTLMMMGLLPFDPPANAYPPGHFSPEYGNLPFLRGASLGPLFQLVPPVAAAAAGV